MSDQTNTTVGDDERYIVTFSGERINHRAGSPTIHDIALNHCRTPMYSGHTKRFQSVAHHCLGAALLAKEFSTKQIALWTLLHEAECAVYGDIPGPVKILEQRGKEMVMRQRVYDRLLGQDVHPTKEQWDHVEVYDKLEQAAASSFLGLPETVHEQVWRSVGSNQRERALVITAQVYLVFPPALNLDYGCPLFEEFLRAFRAYSF